MSPSNPAEPVNQLVKAINEVNLETAVAQYEAGASLVAQPGMTATGTNALRDALAGFIAMKPVLKTESYKIIQSDDIALYISKWNLKGIGPDGKPVQMGGTSSDILRRQADGRWLIALDNPWGVAILE